MAVLIRLQNKTAILRQGQWRSADPQLEALLNDTQDAWIAETGGPAMTDRDPDRTAAEEMTRRLGGNVSLRLKAGKRSRHAYAARRQLSFQFEHSLQQTGPPRKRRRAPARPVA